MINLEDDDKFPLPSIKELLTMTDEEKEEFRQKMFRAALKDRQIIVEVFAKMREARKKYLDHAIEQIAKIPDSAMIDNPLLFALKYDLQGFVLSYKEDDQIYKMIEAILLNDIEFRSDMKALVKAMISSDKEMLQKLDSKMKEREKTDEESRQQYHGLYEKLATSKKKFERYDRYFEDLEKGKF